MREQLHGFRHVGRANGCGYSKQVAHSTLYVLHIACSGLLGGGRGQLSVPSFISAKVLGLCDPLGPSLLASSCFELIMPASWCGWLYLGDTIFLVAELVRGLFFTWEPHKRHPCSMMDNILPPNVSFFVILLLPDSISCSCFG